MIRLYIVFTFTVFWQIKSKKRAHIQYRHLAVAAFFQKNKSEADEKKHAVILYSCQGVFIDRFIFRSNFAGMRLPWRCHGQAQATNWRHCVTGPQLPFFHKRKGVLKIDQSEKCREIGLVWGLHAPTHRLWINLVILQVSRELENVSQFYKRKG